VFYNDEYHMSCPTFENNSYCYFDIYLFVYFFYNYLERMF
jgi:hypothetical protein